MQYLRLIHQHHIGYLVSSDPNSFIVQSISPLKIFLSRKTCETIMTEQYDILSVFTVLVEGYVVDNSKIVSIKRLQFYTLFWSSFSQGMQAYDCRRRPPPPMGKEGQHNICLPLPFVVDILIICVSWC